MRLDRGFFACPASHVAPNLVGCVLTTRFVGGETSGIIVETEAYAGPEDLASHAGRLAKGRERMAGPPGIAYVYRSHGIHAMFNVVCGPIGEPSAVLVRALKPTDGIESMADRRGIPNLALFCKGPGRLCRAMGITLEHDGVDLTLSEQIVLTVGEAPTCVSVSDRIGISRARETPWRFFDQTSLFVSAHRRGVPIATGGSMDEEGPGDTLTLSSR